MCGKIPKAILHSVTFGWHLRFLLNRKVFKIVPNHQFTKQLSKRAGEVGIKYEILSYLYGMWRLIKYVPINNSMGEILVAMFAVDDKSWFQASFSIGLLIQVYVRHLGWEAEYIKALTVTRVMQLKSCTVLLKCQGLMLFKCSIWWFNCVMLHCLLLHINANEILIVDRKFSSAKYTLTYCAAIVK